MVVVFDESLDVQSFIRAKSLNDVKRIILFPLSSHYQLTQELKKHLGSRDIEVIEIDSANGVNQAMCNLRNEFHEWSYRLGEQKVGKKNLKEWLLLPGCNLSAWWMSLLASQNTIATNAYFKMAQVFAIEQCLKEYSPNVCHVALSDYETRKSLSLLCKEMNIRFVKLKKLKSCSRKSLKDRVRNQLKSLRFFGHLLLGFYNIFSEFYKGCQIRKILGKRKERFPDSNSLCFIGCFPAIEKEAAKRGEYRNTFAFTLQDFMKSEGIAMTWLLMPIPYDGYTFSDSLNLAKRFVQNGEKLFFVQEFLTIKGMLKALLLWVRQVFISTFLFRRLKHHGLYTKVINPCYYPMIKTLWASSFVDAIGASGILYSQIFSEFFKKVPNIVDCLYYFEMNSWGKALCAAKNKFKPKTRIIGFQHSVLSKNYLHYFPHPKQLIIEGLLTDLPMPDVLASNGELTGAMLSTCYPSLIELESVRYLSINKVLSESMPQHTSLPVLLVACAGGISGIKETRSMIQLINAAYPKVTNFEIWFKPHPTINIREIFDELDIQCEQCGYKIVDTNISQCLMRAWGVVVGSSTVALEGLAHGCEIILPVFVDAPLMSPLMDFNEYCYTVSTPEELLQTWNKVKLSEFRADIDRKREFVRQYWCLDAGLPRWRALFKGRY